MRNKQRVFEHIIFWGGYWLILSFSAGLYDLDFTITALFNLSHLPLTILFCYLFVYRIIPLFFEGKHLAFFACSVLSLAATLLLKRVSTQYIQFPLFYSDSSYTFQFFDWYRIAGHFVHLVALVGIVSGFKYYREWRRARERLKALDAEKRAAELSFLKAQIHPHFLFNTLNSIYYEVLQKSDRAPDLIIRLSEILRFTLYECDRPYIPIAKEIELIQNYLELEKSRYGDRLSVDFRVDGEREKLIPPLICFSLVENAFKHGTSQNTEHSRIGISLDIDEQWLRLEVRNPVAIPEQPDEMGASKGIGLGNVTKQLDLIFGDRYRLDSEQNADQFTSTLKIPLD